MRRRLVAVIAGAVAAAVVLVGLGTLLLTEVDARHRTEDDLARHLTELAAVLAEVRPGRTAPVTRRLEPALDVDTVRLVGLDAAPPPLGARELERLRGGETVSGRRGDTAYAAAPLPRPAGGPAGRALLATDSTDLDLGAAGRWFVVAGAATVLVGALIALRVAGSVAGPVTDAEAAARRIAGGDLAARVPVPDGGAAGGGGGGAGDELARLAGSINAMAASLERAQHAERDFLLSVSHDLRTPLTSIGGWAEALTDGTAPDPAAAGATILAESGRLDRLVRDLLDLARLRTRAFALDTGPVDLRDVAAGTAEGLRPELEDAGLAVTVEVAAEPVVVEGDADRLAQVAANLVENAGRHAAGRVHVSAAADGDRALLAVTDDGPGIPAGERERVFERLHSRARTAARPGTGTGLGLAIVAELVAAMGGAVAVDDGDGAGARFVVSLPRRPG